MGDPGYDKLGKVSKGRSSMKQCLPKKPVKRGFKVWVQADAVTGYICEFEVYTGKTDGQP